MDKINTLILSGKLEEALQIINEEIFHPKNQGKDKYYEILFAKARIFIIKYMNTKPKNNKLYILAKENFAMANCAYIAMYKKQHPDYEHAVKAADRSYVDFNRK